MISIYECVQLKVAVKIAGRALPVLLVRAFLEPGSVTATTTAATAATKIPTCAIRTVSHLYS